MRVTVNGSEGPLAPLPDETLGDYFGRLNSHFEARREAVVSLRLDGGNVDLEAQEALWASLCSTHQTLEIEAVPHAELSRRTLADLHELVTKCPGACLEAASLFQTGAAAEGLKRLDDIFKVWAVLFQSLSDAAAFHHFRLTEISVGGAPLPTLLGGLSEMIRRLQEAVKVRDYVTVADLLEYEMTEAVPGWLAALEAVRARTLGPHEPS